MAKSLVPPIIRSDPPKKANYSQYKDEVRRDFFHSCAYCTVMEREAGAVGFSIDHYIPKSKPAGKSLEHVFDNLLWSCADCNSYKKDYLPTEAREQLGLVIIRPDRMIPSEHLKLDQEDPTQITHLTVTGDFNVAKLDLNRPGLREIRRIRIQFEGGSAFVRDGITALRNVSIDGLKPNKRGVILKLRKLVEDKAGELEQDLDDLLLDYARSPLLCDDPNVKARRKERKGHLQKLMDGHL